MLAQKEKGFVQEPHGLGEGWTPVCESVLFLLKSPVLHREREGKAVLYSFILLAFVCLGTLSFYISSFGLAQALSVLCLAFGPLRPSICISGLQHAQVLSLHLCSLWHAQCQDPLLHRLGQRGRLPSAL